MIMVFGVMVIILRGAKVMMVPPPNRIVLVILGTRGQVPRAIIIVLGPCPAIQCKNDHNCCSEKQRKAEPTHGRPHTS